MTYTAYEGHPHQIRGVERYALVGGRGDGMRLLHVRNGLGLEFDIAEDRCADIVRLSFRGVNCGYFAPAGFAAPAYYDKDGTGFLKSFTAGFFTTCGLRAVGSPCEDDGETLPLHGTISHTPAESVMISEHAEEIIITAEIRDAVLFADKLTLRRTYRISCRQNTVALHDEVVNEGSRTSPVMLLYHCNMGYPLLSETSEVLIPHVSVSARNAHAAASIETARVMEQPQADYEECCYYYDMQQMRGRAYAGIYNRTVGTGVVLSYDPTGLDCFTEWKMMGKHDYVLGLEPGNCYPDGRDVMRERGILKTLAPDGRYQTDLSFAFYDTYTAFKENF